MAVCGVEGCVLAVPVGVELPVLGVLLVVGEPVTVGAGGTKAPELPELPGMPGCQIRTQRPRSLTYAQESAQRFEP